MPEQETKAPDAGARRWRIVERLLWALAIGFIGWRVWPQLAASVGVPTASAAAPDFHARTLAGDSVSLDSLRGKVVLLNFWATWCPPCRVEMPGFQSAWESRRDKGFVVLGVSTDLRGEQFVRDFLAERGYTYPVVLGTQELVRSYGGARVLPTSFLIDRQGRIRHEIKGIYARPLLEAAVDRLLAE
ncbi:MAG TPA: TlpA disulfide reductase family protein [Gemmatimonadaceae bacterium]